MLPQNIIKDIRDKKTYMPMEKGIKYRYIHPYNLLFDKGFSSSGWSTDHSLVLLVHHSKKQWHQYKENLLK